MTKKKLKEFKDLLNLKLKELLVEAKETLSGMTDVKDNVPDITDVASLESDRNFLLRIRDRERKLIIKIREALDRIDKGSFGQCEICSEEISEERLHARPVTTQCIECKTEMEEAEKRTKRE